MKNSRVQGAETLAEPIIRRFFLFSQLVVCSQHPTILLWGLLRAPSDIVLLQGGSKNNQLVRVSIPTSFDAGGELAYGFLKSSATLVVKTATGALAKTTPLKRPRRTMNVLAAQRA